MFNPSKLFKVKNAWDTFSSNHPKFAMFLNALHQTGLEEGSIIEINVTTAAGKTLSSNLKLTKSDMDLFRELSDLARK